MLFDDSRVRLPGWRSEAGRLRYVEAYRRAQALYEAAAEDLEIPTRYGTTHALVSGRRGARPVFLLHAAFNTGAIQWYPNVAALSREYLVVALDFVGAPGLSQQTAPILDRGDCAAWLGEVVDAFDTDSAQLVGSSHGGWLALNLAVAEPGKVGKLALLAPAASLLPFRKGAMLSIRLGPYMPGWTAGPSLRPIFGKRHRVDKRLVDLLALSLSDFRFQEAAVFPDAFSDDELRSVSAQTLVLLGDKEIIYDPEDALRRAGSLIPDVRTELVPDTGHLLNLERPELVNQALLAFLGSQQLRHLYT
jgi:pimeloyl-ACP methyl ester carboxylesterase